MEFWLLDINSEQRDGKSEVWLWGVTSDRRRALLTDNYRPYFYLVPRTGQDPVLFKERLEKERPSPEITRVSLERKKLLAKETVVVRVETNTFENLEKLATKITKLLNAEAHFEADLRPATKYQNDFQIRPCRWYTVPSESESKRKEALTVDEIMHAKDRPGPTGAENLPELRAMAFSILAVSQVGSPSPEAEPVRLLAWASNAGRNGLLQSTGRSDEALLKKFSLVLQTEDPDFVFSFGGNSVQWPYLLRRAKAQGIELAIGRDGGPPRQSLYGHFSVTGRANVDLLELAEDIYAVKEKSLAALAQYLGVKDARQQAIDETDFFEFWSHPEKRIVLAETVGQEAETLLNLGVDALDYVTQLSLLSGLPSDQVLTAAVGFRVDSHMMLEAHKLGQLIPSRNEVPIIPYQGAIVLEPQPGLHDNVAVLDFTSMYPSLMVKYNISPDTLTTNDDDTETFSIPEIGTRFRKKPVGLYAHVLSELIQNRQRLKAEIARTQKGTSQYRFLKARERATKIIINATYGYAGWAGSRWYSKEVAESAAAMGRDTINKSIEIAKDTGLKVLYGDTDSLFVDFDKNQVENFISRIERELGMEINLSQVYKRILFTEARKKYAGLKENGELEVVGMETIRGDWSLLAKEVQSKILETVLEDRNPTRALSYIRAIAHELGSQKRPISSFIIWKTLTKRPEQYDIHAPHVEAAKKLAKLGWRVGSGDRVGYVITKGTGKLYQRAEPYFKVSINDVDADYYMDNQVLPVAARALSVLGISEDNILEAKV